MLKSNKSLINTIGKSIKAYITPTLIIIIIFLFPDNIYYNYYLVIFSIIIGIIGILITSFSIFLLSLDITENSKIVKFINNNILFRKLFKSVISIKLNGKHLIVPTTNYLIKHNILYLFIIIFIIFFSSII